MKRSWIKLFSLQNIIAVVTIILAIIFWFYKVDGLPAKVSNHETRITQLENETIELRTTLKLTLQAVYEIRNDVKQLMLEKSKR